jgi:hypothetical protein
MTTTPIIFLSLHRKDGEIQISSPALTPDAFGLTYYYPGEVDPPPVRFGVPVVDDLGGSFDTSEIEAACGPKGACAVPWTEVEALDGGAYRLSPWLNLNDDRTITITAKPQSTAAGLKGGAYVRLRRKGGGGGLGD